MDYLIFNYGGSISEKHLNQYIQQGDNNKQFTVKVYGINSSSGLLAEAVYTLPTKETVVSAGVWDAGEKIWLFTIPGAATNYSGSVLVAIRIRFVDSGVDRVNYPFPLIINETGVQPETDTGITLEELDDFLTAVKNMLNLRNGSPDGSIEQKTVYTGDDPFYTDFKAATAIGKNSIAFGIGDEYLFVWNVNDLVLTINPDFGGTVNAGWQNMVLRTEKGEYRRIVSVDTGTNSITIDSAITVGISNSISASVITGVAMGTGSYVCGNHCQAFGEASRAEGIYTIAAGDAQTVVGQFNDVDSNALFIVGNGTAINNRKNAFAVYPDGSIKINGNDAGAKLYVHHFDVVLTDNDIGGLPSGTTVTINVNAISNDGNQWATLEELDGKGYILSAFGQIVLPTPQVSPIFELKLFYKDYGNGTLLLQVNNLMDATVTCVTVMGKNTFALQDSVSAIN